MYTLPAFSALDIFLLWASIIGFSLFLYSAYRLRETNRKLDSVKNEEKNRWKDLELQAQKDYQKIIETANNKAQDIIFQAAQIQHESTTKFDSFVEQMLENQKSALSTTSSALSKKHDEEINGLNNHILNLLTNVYKDIEVSAKTDLEQYKKLLQQQTFDAERIAQKRVQEEYVKLEKEIQQKRDERFKELDDNIYKVLSKVSKNIVGKSLDTSTQQDLILNSLDKAKRDGAL